MHINHLRQWVTTPMDFGKPFGIPLKIHWSVFLGLLVVLTSKLHETLPVQIGQCLLVTITFTIVYFHELAHAIFARRYGRATPTIQLSLLGGFIHIEMNPPDKTKKQIAKENFIIASAGPLVNLILAFALGTLVLVFPPENLRNAFLFPSASPENFLWMVFTLNAILLSLTMLPISPLDGGRMLKAFYQIYSQDEPTVIRATQYTALLTSTGTIFALCSINAWVPSVILAVLTAIGLAAEEHSLFLHNKAQCPNPHPATREL